VVDTHNSPSPEPRRPWWKPQGVDFWVAIGNAAAVAGVVVALIATLTLSSANTSKATHPHPIDYFPYVLILGGLVAVVVLGVGFLAARAGIRKRERRRDLVERLIAREVVGDDDAFTKDASLTFVAAVEQFARDLMDLSKTVSRREAADVVSARQIRRAAELLSLGSASRRGSRLGSLGGVFLGAGLAEMFVILSSAQYSDVSIGLSFGASLVGVAFLAFQWFSS
jgi:hypothetical protein